MTTIVQINFDYDDSAEDLLMHASEVAPKFLGIDGLLWKIWLGNDEEKGTGGIYLFESRESAAAYLQSDLVAGIRAKRKNVLIRIYDVLEGPSAITKGSIGSR